MKSNRWFSFQDSWLKRRSPASGSTTGSAGSPMRRWVVDCQSFM